MQENKSFAKVAEWTDFGESLELCYRFNTNRDGGEDGELSKDIVEDKETVENMGRENMRKKATLTYKANWCGFSLHWMSLNI